MLIFSDGIWLLSLQHKYPARLECSLCAICDSWCNLSVYSRAIVKCNFWNEWLSPEFPAWEGFFPPHSRCPLTLFCQGSEETKFHFFSPGAGEQVVFV